MTAKTFSALRATIFQDPRAIASQAYADGMLLAYNEAEAHPRRINRLIAWAKRHGEVITDNSNYTNRDRNLNAGKITGYKNAKEAINEHSL